MRTDYRRPIDTRTLATRGAGALAIALIVNLAIGWLALMVLHVPPAVVAVLAVPESPPGR